jgi:uncharacterized protein (TIRG00374 family)
LPGRRTQHNPGMDPYSLVAPGDKPGMLGQLALGAAAGELIVVSELQQPVTDPRPKSWLRREWRLLAGLALSAVCILLAVRGVSLQGLRDALLVTRWEWVACAIVVVVTGTILKAIRWRALFYPQKVGLARAWAVFMIGQMLNAVLPARAGEIGRIYFIGEDEGISRAKALSTVVVEKIVDLVMLALAYLVAVVWITTTALGLPDWLRYAGASLLPLAVLALSGLLLFAYAGRPTWHFLRRLTNPLPVHWQARGDAAVEQALSGFEVLRRRRTSVQVWGLSILIWVLAAWTNALLFRAFQLPLSPWVALFLLVVLMSGVALPPLPGNIGVIPYLCQLVLSLFGINRETALVYGVVLQMVAYLPLVVLGSGCLLRENWSLRRSASVPDEIQSDNWSPTPANKESSV